MNAPENEETYLTVAEVAETLKLNQQTVRNWIDAGTLPALRVGRRVRIKKSDFQRLLEESYGDLRPRAWPARSRARTTSGAASPSGSPSRARPRTEMKPAA